MQFLFGHVLIATQHRLYVELITGLTHMTAHDRWDTVALCGYAMTDAAGKHPQQMNVLLFLYVAT